MDIYTFEGPDSEELVSKLRRNTIHLYLCAWLGLAAQHARLENTHSFEKRLPIQNEIIARVSRDGRAY
ncbi:MAG: hypothetical protein AAB573_01360 [Patescibacteria group bacterium]